MHHITGREARLSILPDRPGGWMQWFYFMAEAELGTDCTFHRTNAGDCTYPEGWLGHRACVLDGDAWHRIDTAYANGALTIRHRINAGEAAFAYFVPYSLDRHRAFVDRAALGFSVDCLGHSVEERPIERIQAGDGPVQIWIVGRQHSGETMASWWMEGALERLIETDALLRGASVHIVPLANPDGAFHGHLRGNAMGCDLNRQWAAPDPVRAPEVACILAAMDTTGVDLLLDVHGDEVIPHVFIDGYATIPDVSRYQLCGLDAFGELLSQRSSAFQTRVGYPTTYAGSAAAGMCARAVAARFGAIGMTLEMPFSHSIESPDPVDGWSPAQSKQLGRDCIDTLAAFVDSDFARRRTFLSAEGVRKA